MPYLYLYLLAISDYVIMAILQKWAPYSQRYLFNAIPDTNRNANPTNPNRNSKGNPNPTNPYTGTVVNKAPTSAGLPLLLRG